MFFELFFNMQKIKGSELVSDACRRSVLVSLLINVSTLLLSSFSIGTNVFGLAEVGV